MTSKMFEKPFEIVCANCGKEDYTEGIDFDNLSFCRSCCEDAGVGEKCNHEIEEVKSGGSDSNPLPVCKKCDSIILKATAYDPETLEAEVYHDYEQLREMARKEVMEEIKSNIGQLRQLINELPEGMLLTNKDIEYLLFQ